jgi:pimeloyl-ACP methyl ester carboxylesterase
MPHVEVNGIAAYYDITGTGEPVVFLHGGFCSAEVMRDLSEQLTGFAVYAPERPGHGRTADRPGDFHYADGVLDTVAFMDAVGIRSAHIVGFSDGAIIGMLMALAHPSRVRSLVHISGNLRPGDDVWRPKSERRAAPNSDDPDRETLDYARLSPDGAEHGANVLARILRLWETEPLITVDQLAGLRLPVLVIAGDDDIISSEHTRLVQRSIPDSQLAIVPGTSHMLVRERPRLVGLIVQEFLDGVRDS